MLCEGLQWPDATSGAGSNPGNRAMRRTTWTALLALVSAAALAQSEPPGCAGLSAEVRANYLEVRDGKLVPVCPVEPQAAREAADPCKQLGAQATATSRQWNLAQEYLKRTRYKHMSVTVRDTHLHHIRDKAHAESLAADAEGRYPVLLDELLAGRCADDMPYDVANGYRDKMLYAMVQEGRLTWEKWATWEWKNLLKP